MITEEEKNAISIHYQQLSLNFNGFKNRKSQRIMIAEVAKTFGNSTIERNIKDATCQKNIDGDTILSSKVPQVLGRV